MTDEEFEMEAKRRGYFKCRHLSVSSMPMDEDGYTMKCHACGARGKVVYETAKNGSNLNFQDDAT